MSDRHVVGAYASYEEAMKVLEILASRGFDRRSLGVVSPHVHRDDEIVGFVPRGKVAAAGALHGALWGMGLGLLVALLTQLPQPSTEPWVLRFLILFLYGVTLGGLAGLVLGALACWSVAPRFFIAPDVSGAAERFSLVVDATAPSARRARDEVLTIERDPLHAMPTGLQVV